MPKKWKQMAGNKHKSQKDLGYDYFNIYNPIFNPMRYSGQFAVEICHKLLTPPQSLALHSRVLWQRGEIFQVCVFRLQAYYSIFIFGLKETLTSVRQQTGFTANYKTTGKIHEVMVPFLFCTLRLDTKHSAVVSVLTRGQRKNRVPTIRLPKPTELTNVIGENFPMR